MVQLLLNRGADPNYISHDINYGTSALLFAAYKGYTTIVKSLLDRGADLSLSNDDGSSALMEAVRGNHKDTVKLLFIQYS